MADITQREYLMDAIPYHMHPIRDNSYPDSINPQSRKLRVVNLSYWSQRWSTFTENKRYIVLRDDLKANKQRLQTKALDITTHFLSTLSGAIGPGRTPILSLENELLAKIYDHTTLLDKVCLSLTCKKFYGLFRTISKDPQLVFPRLLLIRTPILCVNSKDLLRNQFLLRLENRKWTYCGDCLKLHPRKEFPKAALRGPRLEWRCQSEAGIVDLCPCIALTIRQRDKIIQMLESYKGSCETQYGSLKYGADGKPAIMHNCAFSLRDGYTISISMRLFFQTSKNQPPAIGLCAKGLIAETSYTVSFSGTKSHLTAEPIFACPHTDLMSLIRWRDVCKACSHCWSWIERSPLVWGGTSPVGYKVTRCLGGYEQLAEPGGNETQKYWEKNCRLTKSEFASYKDYWYVEDVHLEC
ncbi:hypothetical protein N7540_000950 [Penicillium herquei]|nr:hypothetical protein N7540_000950 [Penicillium herquei]